MERAWFFSRDVLPAARVSFVDSTRSRVATSTSEDDARTEAIVVRLDGAVYVLWPDADRVGTLAVSRLGSECCPLLPSRCAEVLIRGPAILPPIECDVASCERGIRLTRAEDGSRVLEVDVDDLGRLVVARWIVEPDRVGAP
jgi:hypothetical protein